MGTNYYWRTKPCECCGRYYEQHIGKSSYGWAFSLHVTMDGGMNDLSAWRLAFDIPGSRIVNEYEEEISQEKMIEIITDRGGDLARHEVDGTHCIGHGAGTWDLIIGEFS